MEEENLSGKAKKNNKGIIISGAIGIIIGAVIV